MYIYIYIAIYMYIYTYISKKPVVVVSLRIAQIYGQPFQSYTTDHKGPHDKRNWRIFVAREIPIKSGAFYLG